VKPKFFHKKAGLLSGKVVARLHKPPAQDVGLKGQHASTKFRPAFGYRGAEDKKGEPIILKEFIRLADATRPHRRERVAFQA
jgi:hypothetical protein